MSKKKKIKIFRSFTLVCEKESKCQNYAVF